MESLGCLKHISFYHLKTLSIFSAIFNQVSISMTENFWHRKEPTVPMYALVQGHFRIPLLWEFVRMTWKRKPQFIFSWENLVRKFCSRKPLRMQEDLHTTLFFIEELLWFSDHMPSNESSPDERSCYCQSELHESSFKIEGEGTWFELAEDKVSLNVL